MIEDRLSSLALISIEKTFANKVNYNNVIDYFAKMKPRQKKIQRLFYIHVKVLHSELIY